MINGDDDSDSYPLFSDHGASDNGLWDASQTMSLCSIGDAECNSLASESPFDSAVFLSDDIANYNFLEPLMPISALDDSGGHGSEPEQSPTPSLVADTHRGGAHRTSYTFDPVSRAIVRCVVPPSPIPLAPSAVTRAAENASAQNGDKSPLNVGVDDELDTVDITRRVSEELRRCNISQALFAQAVLGRSQGTLSDLLRKPKPWAQLKSGRETFARMQQWLLEPEKQRLADLNVSGEQYAFSCSISAMC